MTKKVIPKKQSSPNAKLWPVLLLLFALFSVVGASAQSGRLFNLYDDSVQAVKVIVGPRGPAGIAGTNGTNGLDGVNGVIGKDGAPGPAGSNGAAGANGAQGVPGSNDCISGICVSRQSTTPGTQETGNINIDGSVLATQIGINDTTPSNTLTVNGTMDVQGHSAFGSGSVINGATFLSDAFGVSQHNSLISNYETLTTLNDASTMYEGLTNAITLNPSSAPSYYQISGLNGVAQVASGNAQDFTAALVGGSMAIQHGGTGDITNAVGAQGAILKLSSGDITTASGIKSTIVNGSASGEITTANGLEVGISFNAGTIGTYNGVNVNANSANVTTNRGLYVQSATGTKTNNYGLYIEDQSGAGSSNSYNIYSAGSTAKNFFAGKVEVGSSNEYIQGLGTSDYFEFTKASGRGFKFTGGYSGYSAGQYGFVIETAYFNGASNAGLVSIGATTAGTSVNTGASSYDALNVGLNMEFDPTSGTTTFQGITVDPTINQTGSASGITRGLYINPTLTAAADFRGIEIANSSGFGVYQSGPSADNYFAGNVGIGTSDPQYELQISQNATWNSSLAITHTTSNKTLHLSTTGGATSSWNIENASGLLYFYNTSLTETSLELKDDGNVGIGTNFGSAGAKLHVKEDTDTTVLRLQDSDGTCDLNPESGSLTTTCSSDERLKTNITDAASVLSEINGLKIHDYTVIASGQQTTGLIAQEVINTNPEMVHMGEDGYYKVDSYNPWKVLKGIQELSTNADDLQTTFTTALEKTNGDLSATNEILAALGLRVDDLSETMQEFADRLAQTETKNSSQDDDIASLKAEIQALKQQLSGLSQNPSTTD